MQVEICGLCGLGTFALPCGLSTFDTYRRNKLVVGRQIFEIAWRPTVER